MKTRHVLILTLPLINCIKADKAFLSFLFPVSKVGITVLLHEVGVRMSGLKYSTWNSRQSSIDGIYDLTVISILGTVNYDLKLTITISLVMYEDWEKVLKQHSLGW